MNIVSTQKFIRTSPRKLREVVHLTKGLTPQEAVEKLPYVRKRAVEPLVKALKTAIANAKDRGLDLQNLKLEEIRINEGPVLKRWRAGARGRAKPYQRRMSHIRVVVSAKPVEKKETAKKTKKKSADTKGTKKGKK